MSETQLRYVDEYRDKTLVDSLSEKIKISAIHDYVFMEVCGGHTAAIHRFGITSLLPSNIRLVSGPGCPVCVTPADFIDRTIEYSKSPEVIISTFGDLIRVPGSESSLEKEKALGADIRIVFSALDALDIARSNPDRKIIFAGIGFETTAPGTAVTILQAGQENIDNFYLLSAHKVMPPAMKAIVNDGVKLNGFICPGHVAAITGSEIFRFLPEVYGIGCVVSGFEPVDLLQSVLMLVRQVNNKYPVIENEYRRAVKADGNKNARGKMEEVFESTGTKWRGLGEIPGSGLKLRRKFERFDAEIVFPVTLSHPEENTSCLCGNILRGINTPLDCPLFAKSCVPENPAGACMVSAEGTCNVFYRYRS